VLRRLPLASASAQNLLRPPPPSSSPSPHGSMCVPARPHACLPLRAKTQRTAHRHTGSDGDLARAGGRTDKTGGCDALPRAPWPAVPAPHAVSGYGATAIDCCTSGKGTILNRASPLLPSSDALGQGASNCHFDGRTEGRTDGWIPFRFSGSRRRAVCLWVSDHGLVPPWLRLCFGL
jgi:hypothetical protein